LGVAPALDDEIQNLAFGFHGAPEAIALPLDDNYHLVEVQAIAGLRAGTTQVGGGDIFKRFCHELGCASGADPVKLGHVKIGHDGDTERPCCCGALQIMPDLRHS
jgi:hypothetical protein